jgi:hypothetical protein
MFASRGEQNMPRTITSTLFLAAALLLTFILLSPPAHAQSTPTTATAVTSTSTAAPPPRPATKSPLKSTSSFSSASSTPPITFLEFDTLTDDKKNTALIRAVDDLIRHEQADPKIAGAIWGYFYPELVNYAAKSKVFEQNGKKDFWEFYLDVKDRNALNDSPIADQVQQIALKNVPGAGDNYQDPAPPLPPAPYVNPFTYGGFAKLPPEQQRAYVEGPMHEIVTRLAARNPERARFAQAYFFSPSKDSHESVGFNQLVFAITKTKNMISTRDMDPDTVRFDVIELRIFENWEHTLQNSTWRASRAHASYALARAQLDRKKKDQDRSDAVECRAIPLHNGQKVYVDKNGDFIDADGNLLQGDPLAEAKAYDASTSENQQRVAKCLADHHISTSASSQ